MSAAGEQPERSQFDEPVRPARARRGEGAPPRILLVQTGGAGALVPAHGDYPDWFRAALGASADEMPVLRAHQGERLSPEAIAAQGAEGIIVTGSPLSVTAREPWMLELGGELQRAGARGVPVLGVCFGHQLLCESAGVSVVKNPRGREIGSVQVQLTAAGARDPLFAWAQEEAGRVWVQATHVDAVYPVPAGAALLASNENTPVQAVRFSECVASVQFHPELRPAALRALIESRRALLDAEGLDPDALAAAVRETGSAAILRAFAEQVRRA